MSATLGAWVAFTGPTPPEHDVRGLARYLGEAAGVVVDPRDIVWAESGGIAEDWAVGRSVFFLGSERPESPRDLYRGRVRLDLSGRAWGRPSVWNLTNTPLGDDHALVARDGRVAFATFAYGQEQSVTLLTFGPRSDSDASLSERELAADQPRDRLERAMRAVTHLQATGSVAGFARVNVSFDTPARAVGLALDPAALSIDFIDGNTRRQVTFDLRRGELRDANSGADVAGLRAERAEELPKRFVHWAVDTARAVPWIGPAPIAWLEDRAFEARDFVRKTSFHAAHGEEAVATLDTTSAVAPTLRYAPEAELSAWPPAPMASMWPHAEVGEGEWVLPRPPWIKRLPSTDGVAEVPAPFYRTFVRPDRERPYVRVLLVAMDMRQLELGMVAGSEDPKPLVGAAGPGRIPRDPVISTRVAAAFNGAFKTEHGRYGMVVNRRVLLPPQPHAATVAVLRDGRVAMGPWGSSASLDGIANLAPGAIVSLRQNLDPLVDHGELNPSRRTLWGFTLPGQGAQTERSGLCVNPRGHLIYAWGEDLSASVLGRAMTMAGCTFGMHLDMNPHHTGFLFANVTDLKARAFRSELLTPEMTIPADRYIEHAAKDFFYVALRDPSPKVLVEERWQPSDGAQPEPAWLPAIWSTRVDSAELWTFDSARVSWRLVAGGHEPDARTGTSKAPGLDEADAGRVLVIAGLGVGREERAHRVPGLVVRGRIVHPLSSQDDRAVLVMSDARGVSLARASEHVELAATDDAVELPLLLEDGTVKTQAVGVVSAIAVTLDGQVLVARGPLSSVSLAFRRAGCPRVALLDRGARASHQVTRLAARAALDLAGGETVLTGLARAMPPQAFRFEAVSGENDLRR